MFNSSFVLLTLSALVLWSCSTSDADIPTRDSKTDGGGADANSGGNNGTNGGQNNGQQNNGGQNNGANNGGGSVKKPALVSYLPVFESLALANPQAGLQDDTLAYDVMSHLPESFGNSYYDDDRLVWTMKTAGGLSLHLRTITASRGSTNCVYLLQSRFVCMLESAVKKSSLTGYIPSTLRGPLYTSLVTGSADWNDKPTYLIDMWHRYLLTARVGTDLVSKNLWLASEKRRVLSDLIEAMILGTSLVFAIEDLDPSYAASPKYAELKVLIGYMMQETGKTFKSGRLMPAFGSSEQDILVDKLLNSTETAALRARIEKTFGAEWAATLWSEFR